MPRPIRLADFMLGLADVVRKYPQLATAHMVVEQEDGLHLAFSFDLKELMHTPHADHEGPDNIEGTFVTLELRTTVPDPDDPNAYPIGVDRPSEGKIH